MPALDGLRAVAVAAVIAHHYNNGRGWSGGAFLGVDVFFVLSGFLITSLLLIDHARTGRVVSLRFWARRARRLFPALLVFLVLVAVYSAFAAPSYDLHTIRGSSLATLFYVNNYWAIAHPPITVVSQTWSLSIEEQFYLVWPLLLAAIAWAARGRRSWLLAIVGALTVASAIRMSMSSGHQVPAYMRTDGRAQELLVGAALGVAMLGLHAPSRRRTRLAVEAAGIAGFAFLALVVAFTRATDGFRWLFQGGYLLVAVASALVIAAAMQPTSPVLGRALSSRPLVAVGLISYGLYLFHTVVFAWLDPARVHAGGIELFALRMIVLTVLAVASYHFVEKPIRSGAMSWPRVRVVAPVAIVAVFGLVLVSTRGYAPASPSVLKGIYYRELALAAPHGSTRVLVAGDGVAWSLGNTVGGAFRGDGIYGATTGIFNCNIVSGAPPGSSKDVKSSCADWPDAYRTAANSFDPDISVVMVDATEVLDRVVDGRRLRVGTPRYEAYLIAQLEEARKALTHKGASLVVLTSSCPYLRSAPRSDLARFNDHRIWVNSVYSRYAAEHPRRVRIADYGDYMCPGGVPRVSVGTEPARDANGVFLSQAGAIATWSWLARTPPIRSQIRQHH